MLRSTIMAHMSEALTESKYRFKQLKEIEKEISWDNLVAEVEPSYLASSIGRNLIPLEVMIRIYFLQYRYSMSAAGLEEALFQIEVLRSFANIDLSKDVIPSETMIESFNHLLSEKGLKSKLIASFDLEPLISI
jgi:IS5 family transposase